MRTLRSLVVLALLAAAPAAAQTREHADYRVLATNKTSTMEKELNAAAQAGFRFDLVMGGETGFGGKEVVVIAARKPGVRARYEYRLLATNKTSTMQKELADAAADGYEVVGMTVGKTAIGGSELVTILRRAARE